MRTNPLKNKNHETDNMGGRGNKIFAQNEVFYSRGNRLDMFMIIDMLTTLL